MMIYIDTGFKISFPDGMEIEMNRCLQETDMPQ